MDKTTELWSVTDLANRFTTINFPEYQREPNVWSLDAKQRLIDSMLRQFDIASIYLYKDEDDSIDCIDGRQRINAIMSFLNKNPKDLEHNGFQFRVLNEIYADEDHTYAALDKMPLLDIEERAREGDNAAKGLTAAFANYRLTIVLLSGSRRPAEFNLQFTRLNLGTIINSGEKLHAMVGELRDICFNEIGQHPFFAKTRIPTRRYAKEQVAAQLLFQLLSLDSTGDYTRTRHFDLQKAFKEYAKLTFAQKDVVSEARIVLDLLESAFAELGTLRNRAITVSTVLLAMELGISDETGAQQLATFIGGFVCRLQWQVKKGLDVDEEYRHLVDFQRHLTQASVEKPAVKERGQMLRKEFERWRDSGDYSGDYEFKNRTGADPSEECASKQ